MPRVDSNKFARVNLIPNLKIFSLNELKLAERLIMTRLQGVDRFYPWPALTESFAQDLRAIWNEQKIRSSDKK